MLYTTTGNLFFLFWRTLSLFASSSSFISCVSVCLVMNFLPLICSDVHLSPWLDEIELPNRRICDVHFRLTLALSFSFFSPAGRKEKHASRNERRRRKSFLFFFLSFFPSLSSGPSFFLLIFSPSPSLQTRSEKSLVSSFLPFYLLG